MTPPGTDEGDEQRGETPGPQRERADGRSGLHEGERVPPEGEPHRSGLNERPPRHRGPSENVGRSSEPRDPVQESFAGQVDLYEIATWEVRSPLDRFAVRLTNALETSKRALLLSVAIGLFVVQVAAAGALVVQAPILGWLAGISAAPALVLAGYFWYGDPTTREPFVGLAVTFLLAVAFASIAGVVNSIAQPFFQLFGVVGVTLFYFLIVGPIEETVKWLAVRIYAYRTDVFRTVVDGVVYGAMAGVGFAAIENLLYILMFSVETTTAGLAVQQERAIAIATQRAFVGPGHVIFSAWAGFYLGLAKFNRGKRGPIVVKGLLIAAFIHALYNTLVTNLPLSLLTFIAFLVVYHGFWFALLYRKIRLYRSLYRQRPNRSPGPPDRQSR
ncbi:PrsW family intramembrane metalloprotease [Halovenus sp. WSH3]|uniref:PrsW family intramembrane metalloprotease n=1 Tax=Halovenus carboxidivorans TaxID=2692199 RepID=A0A6B0T6D5_9EURY|nr:PrsW family intramembrane metalloprotease [Halovenus carboxidivorans]MXR50781.1 PrsW family intramembrane metalloprotease [Halovenus carboxidivorans]